MATIDMRTKWQRKWIEERTSEKVALARAIATDDDVVAGRKRFYLRLVAVCKRINRMLCILTATYTI